jgi:hypothetical protein
MARLLFLIATFSFSLFLLSWIPTALMLFAFSSLGFSGRDFGLCLRGTAFVVFVLLVVPGLDVEQYGTMRTS